MLLPPGSLLPSSAPPTPRRRHRRRRCCRGLQQIADWYVQLHKGPLAKGVCWVLRDGALEHPRLLRLQPRQRSRAHTLTPSEKVIPWKKRFLRRQETCIIPT